MKPPLQKKHIWLLGASAFALICTIALAQTAPDPKAQQTTPPSPTTAPVKPSSGLKLPDQSTVQQALKDRIAAQAAKDQAAKDQAARDEAAKQQAAKEASIRADALAARQQAAKEAQAKAQAAKDQLAKEASARQSLRQNVRIIRPLPVSKVEWSKVLPLTTKSLVQARTKPNPMMARLARPEQKVELDRTRLPVLLPRVGGIVDATQGRLFSFGDAFAMNLPQKAGTQIIVYGNRTSVPADKGALSKLRVARISNVAEDMRIAQTEDGWTATFTRYGVVYSIDVGCDDINAPDCKNDGYIRKVIADFNDVTIGAQAQQEALSAGAKP